MNSHDPFEERLRQIPFREAPASLRREVLGVDRSATACAWRDANPVGAWLKNWRWPHRIAWATLGLAWILILLVNLAALDIEGSTPPRRVEQRISPALTAALREQRALRDSLLQESVPSGQPALPGPDAGFWWDRRSGRVVV